MLRKAKFYIYKNLHKNCFSIKQRGKVIKHAEIIYVENAEFKVNEKGRQRVISTGQKNVHAYVVTDNFTIPNNSIMENIIADKCYGLVRYNPYKNHCFTRGLDADNNPIPIYKATKLLLMSPLPVIIKL